MTSFKEVKIAAFDIHTTGDAPAMKRYYRSAFRFLGNAKRYQQQHEARPPETVCNGVLTFASVIVDNSPKDLWTYYTHSSPFDAWKIQLPFVAVLPEQVVELQRPDFLPAAVVIEFRVELYLATLGWSTHVCVLLRSSEGRISRKHVAEVVEWLGGADKRPFQVYGQPHNLTDTFRYVNQLLNEEVYEVNLSGHLPYVPRHFIISINHFAGEVKRYSDRALGVGPVMSLGEQKFMVEMLLGQSLRTKDVAAQQARIMPISISGPNFALTRFDHGTLVFAQREASRPRYTIKPNCLANNIRLSLMMALWLRGYIRAIEKAETVASHPLYSPAISSLGRLPKVYRNKVLDRIMKTDSRFATA